MPMLKDTLVAATLEVALLLVVGFLACLFHAPLIFASLGPTAFEIVETPTRPSAKPRSILIGHGVGLVAALFALSITHAWATPALSVHGLSASRVLAVVLAAFVTVAVTLTLKATQPAALSTTLLVALGTMQTWSEILCIVVGVLIMVGLGEPIRKIRAKKQQDQSTLLTH